MSLLEKLMKLPSNADWRCAIADQKTDPNIEKLRNNIIDYGALNQGIAKETDESKRGDMVVARVLLWREIDHQLAELAK